MTPTRMAHSSPRPHLIIFNPDQWRGDVLGHMGNPAALTPTLDEAARTDFVSFRHAFCQNPVCTPSRCSFMTGWYPHVRGHRTMYHMLHPERGEPNLLSVLKANDYFVWWGGKNDLVPGQDGYEAYCDIKFKVKTNVPGTHSPHYNTRRGDPPPEGDNYFSFYFGEANPPPTGERFQDSDWAVVRGACEFLTTYEGDQPLCLFLTLGYPHPPYLCERPFYGATDRSKLPPRAPTIRDWTGKPSLLSAVAKRQGLGNWSEERWRELRGTYYDMCHRSDHQFGLVLNTLKSRGFYDEAAVFFFSDHGDFTGDYGLVEKTQNTFEECLTHVPLLIKPPKGHPAKPGVRDALVELIDFSATVYDLLGIDPGYDHFGRSLLSVIAGQTSTHRDAVFCEGGRRESEVQASERQSASYADPHGLYYPRMMSQQTIPEHTKATMCRTQRYKYVRRLDESDELYDLESDPMELRNRIDDPALAATAMELKDRMLRWYQETCDVVPREIDQRG